MHISSKKWLLTVVTLVALGILIVAGWMFNEYFNNQNQPTPPAISSPLFPTSSTNGKKIYTNAEFGFEFQYPENWSFQINRYRSQFSKFELLGDSSAENYNPFNPGFIVHIVTPEFANNATVSFRNLNAKISVVTIVGIRGTKYEYEFEDIPQIAIDIPFGEYRMLLGADIDHESDFNQILSTFKFIESNKSNQ